MTTKGLIIITCSFRLQDVLAITGNHNPQQDNDLQIIRLEC